MAKHVYAHARSESTPVGLLLGNLFHLYFSICKVPTIPLVGSLGECVWCSVHHITTEMRVA